MHIVFVHRDGPGQFVHLARRLIAEGWSATLVSQNLDRPVPGLSTVRYGTSSKRHLAGRPSVSPPVPYIAAGRHVAGILDRLAQTNKKPDLIVGHIGWGGMLFVKDVLPNTPAIGYCEYYFQQHGGDHDFGSPRPTSLPEKQTLRLRNAIQLATLDQVDCGISPTLWQKTRYPSAYHAKMAVQHEGVDTRRACPDATASFRLPNGTVLTNGDPVVTFAARDLEPYRGFPQFIRAAALLAKRDPKTIFVVAGGDGTSYGRAHEDGTSWRQVLMQETGLPVDRIHFLGRIPHGDLIRLLQISAAHVYLTYPFVLSWSFLEAMACGAPTIASATAPVEEVVTDGINGRLTDFWDVEQLADLIAHTLTRPPELDRMRAAARQTVVSRFEINACVLRTQHLLQKVLTARTRSSAHALTHTARQPQHPNLFRRQL